MHLVFFRCVQKQRGGTKRTITQNLRRHLKNHTGHPNVMMNAAPNLDADSYEVAHGRELHTVCGGHVLM